MLRTETRNPRTTHIDQMPVGEALRIINEENQEVFAAVDRALPEIERAVNAVAEVIRAGGRVYYLGAGTSGRLGVLDAVECPPTYGVPGDLFNGIIAGGRESVFRSSENAEDRGELAVRDLEAAGFTGKDILIGISAAGGAAYVAGALEYARSLGARTVAVTNNCGTKIAEIAEIAIVADTGPEVITGSTRMKAGTAQKIILNMISTVSLVQCGYVYENLMINLKPSNAKLKNRMVGIVCAILGCDAEEAAERLEAAEWNIRRAVGQARP